jgi:hypothetical protein
MVIHNSKSVAVPKRCFDGAIIRVLEGTDEEVEAFIVAIMITELLLVTDKYHDRIEMKNTD